MNLLERRQTQTSEFDMTCYFGYTLSYAAYYLHAGSGATGAKPATRGAERCCDQQSASLPSLNESKPKPKKR